MANENTRAVQIDGEFLTTEGALREAGATVDEAGIVHVPVPFTGEGRARAGRFAAGIGPDAYGAFRRGLAASVDECLTDARARVAAAAAVLAAGTEAERAIAERLLSIAGGLGDASVDVLADAEATALLRAVGA